MRHTLKDMLLVAQSCLILCDPMDYAAAKSLQLCPTLCNPIDGRPPGSAVPGTLQARTLEWVAISFSNAWKWKVKVKSLSRVQHFVTPWTLQSCPTLCNPIDGRPPGSSIHGIFQARVLEWGAIAFSEVLCLTKINWPYLCGSILILDCLTTEALY